MDGPREQDDTLAEASQRLAAALAHHQAGRLAEAEAAYRRMLADWPDRLLAAPNLAILLRNSDRLDEAGALLAEMLVLRPGDGALCLDLARLRAKAGRHDQALCWAARAARLAPDPAEAFNTQAASLYASGRPAEAAQAAQTALALRPDWSVGLFNRAAALQSLCRPGAAALSYRRAGTANPGHFLSRLNACLARLPMLLPEDDELAGVRDAYGRDLAALLDEVADPAQAAAADLAALPFYLAYHNRDDCALQSAFGQLAARIQAARHPAFATALAPAPPAAGEPLRLGVVSAHFHRHSVWRFLLRGLFHHLDRDRVRLFGYHLGTIRDSETAAAAGLCDGWVSGRHPTEAWARRIREDRPHVLLYPEIGMNAEVAQLAALPLARVQIASWGHPATTGLPTLSHYLSGAAIEPPDGDRHYSERLVRLPGIGACYTPPEVETIPVERAQLGLAAGDVVYWCCQVFYKYRPADHRLFARLAAEIPAARFVFFAIDPLGLGPAPMARFRASLRQAFAALGQDADGRCRFLPCLDMGRYMGAMAQADIYLDAVGFSGANTAAEAMAAGLPVVTIEGPLMRGRLASGLLRRLGVVDGIAADVEGMTRVALRLGRDREARRDLARRQTAALPRLHGDLTVVRAVEDLLEGLASGG